MGNFERSLAFGRVGESVISRWLQGRGHLVFPAYEKELGSGKGPQLFSAAGDLVLPDMLTFSKAGVMWFEAKHKSRFTWYRKKRQWETGIDLRHYHEYREVQARTGVPVWLLFWHPLSEPSAEDLARNCPPKCPTGLFGNDIIYLAANESHQGAEHGPSGMVYWGVDDLKYLASVEDMAA